jgi:pyruvate kinase
MPKERRTKIVCTIGPATESYGMILRLIEAGMDVARLNFSHGTFEGHEQSIRRIRRAAAKLGKPVAILLDLPGPKIRVGKMADDVRLKAGAEIVLTSRKVIGTAKRVSVNFPNLDKVVRAGEEILIDDGRIHLKIREVGGGEIRCRVEHAGVLRSHKGINLPGSVLAIPSLTAYDRKSLAFGLEHDVDYVAVSFVRTAKDLKAAKRIMHAKGKQIPLIAKIEKPQAVENLESILDEADGVMVARGDLGVELPPEKVPLIQKRVIEATNVRGYAVITATEMLHSMIENPRPTRAEASDVANAILDGTDAVMLSGETAAGRYPVQAVRMMARIIRETENAADTCYRDFPDRTFTPSTVVSAAACHAARDVRAKVIVAFTRSGLTARLICKHRPRERILAYTPSEGVLRQLSLVWGITPFYLPISTDMEEMVDWVEQDLRRKGLIQRGEIAVIVGRSPVADGGPTNLLKVHRVNGDSRRKKTSARRKPAQKARKA